jgi:hypothetical protein
MASTIKAEMAKIHFLENKMLKISVDYGYAFDMLAILEVKSFFLDKKNNNYLNLHNEIESQISQEKMQTILKSKEYQDLVITNKKVFDLVDKAQKADGLAKQVDSANYERYTSKVNLQKAFFDAEVTEIKIGYNK